MGVFFILLTSSSIFGFLYEIIPISNKTTIQFFYTTFMPIYYSLHMVHRHVTGVCLSFQWLGHCFPLFFANDRKFFPAVIPEQRDDGLRHLMILRFCSSKGGYFRCFVINTFLKSKGRLFRLIQTRLDKARCHAREGNCVASSYFCLGKMSYQIK